MVVECHLSVILEVLVKRIKKNSKMKKEMIFGIIRHTLTFIGGVLVIKGVVDEATYSEISGALLTLIGGIWSVLEKR